MKITQKNVLSAPDGRYLLERGLYLVVRNEGRSRTFFLRYTYAGKRVDLSLGSAVVKSIAQAKTDAAAARLQLSAGIDPKTARQDAREAKRRERTFAEYFEEVWPRIQETRRYKNSHTVEQFQRMMKLYACPAFGSKAISEITVDDVLSALSPIWETKNRTAVLCRTYLEIVFTQARRDGLMTAQNPAIWRGNLDAYLPAPGRVIATVHRSAADIKTTRQALRTCIEKRYATTLALAVIILTASRQVEICGLRWSEIDFDRRVISIPPERRKDGRPEPHRIPMSAQVERILRAVPRTAEHVFLQRGSTSAPIISTSTNQARKNVLHVKTSTHGFRSTFRDWAAERGVDRVLAEKCLMHATGSAVERAYQRSDLLEQRRPIMQAWADEVLPMDALSDADL